jgi:hypothetical protein
MLSARFQPARPQCKVQAPVGGNNEHVPDANTFALLIVKR